METATAQEIRFRTEIGDDRVIHIPKGIDFPRGAVEVTILRPQAAPVPAEAAEEPLIRRLARMAEEMGISGLPADLAENHDHYIHGLPKGIDSQ